MSTATAPPTTASIVALLDGIERVGSDAPAAIAFKIALTRKGREADAAGGVRAVDDLLREVVLSEPGRADARTSILRAAWADLIPGPGGSAKR